METPAPEPTVRCRVCGGPVPVAAHVCLKCGIWTRVGPTGLYVAGGLKAIAAIATGVALPLVLLVASRKLDERSAHTARTERLQQEQAAAIAKAAADAHEATMLSGEVFEATARIRQVCDEYVAASAIAREPWLGPSCATAFMNAISTLDLGIGKIAYRVDELPVDRATVADMRKLSEAYWGVPGRQESLRQELVEALHVPARGVAGVGLKFCGPLIGQTPDRRAKCDAQLRALQQTMDRIGNATNLVFCGLSHDLAEFRAQLYEVASSGGAGTSLSALFAKRLRDNANTNVCSSILERAHGAVVAAQRRD
jgi:hypothetical protein